MVHKILVVEDEPAVRGLLKDVLTVAGYEVFTAVRGKEALALAKKETPHAILLDLILPDAEGVEICRRLKANETTRSIPVVIMSGFRIELSVIREAGAEGLLYKPFNLEDVLVQVRSIISGRCLLGSDEGVLANHEQLTKDNFK